MADKGTDTSSKSTDPKPTDTPPPETSVDSTGPTTPTVDSLSTAQLAEMVWHQNGSPYGSVQAWVDNSADILGW